MSQSAAVTRVFHFTAVPANAADREAAHLGAVQRLEHVIHKLWVEV